MKLPQPEENKRGAYRKHESIIVSETHVQFLKEGLKYQGGEPLLQRFLDDTERILQQHPKRVALLKLWGGESLWITNLPCAVTPEVRDANGIV